MERRPPTRRLGLSDLMILVAAAGGGLAVFQVLTRTVVLGYRFEHLLMPPQRGWTVGEVVVRVVEWLAPTIPFAGAWTGVVPILRLRSPRPRLRRALRQPGMVACLAAVAGALWAAAGLGEVAGASRLAGSALLPGWLFFFVVEEVFPDVGLAVLASWFGLALAGRWRPVADWPDRLGRSLGCYWVGLGLLWYARRYLSYVMP